MATFWIKVDESEMDFKLYAEIWPFYRRHLAVLQTTSQIIWHYYFWVSLTIMKPRIQI